MSYEEYVQKNLFDKAGMKDAHYCSETKIIKGKVTGYDADSAGLVQKAPISHQWPYAAGSLCSSAIDLVAWNEALHQKGTILGAAAYQEFITPETLTDGSVLGYTKGIAITPRIGRKALHHGGGIPGFLSSNNYFPDDSLSVVVLFNGSGASPDEYAMKIAELVLGKLADQAKPMDGDAARFAAVYAGRGRGRPMEMTIAVADGKVTAKTSFGAKPATLTYIGNNRFLMGEAHVIFGEQGGKIATLRIDSGFGNNVLNRK